MKLIFLPILLFLWSAQNNLNVKEDGSKYIILSPPTNIMLQLEKTQRQYINDKYVSFTTVHDVIFSKTKNPNVIGYDIEVELKKVHNEGEQRLAAILANVKEKIGTVRRFTYDQINNKLTLNNSDIIWTGFLMNIDQIRINAGPRSDNEKLSDQKFLQTIKNIPAQNRNMILSEDINIILSFVGQNLNTLNHNVKGNDIIINQRRERQGGQLIETNRFHISKHNGLVHIFERILKPVENKGHTVRTHYKLYEARDIK